MADGSDDQKCYEASLEQRVAALETVAYHLALQLPSHAEAAHITIASEQEAAPGDADLTLARDMAIGFLQDAVAVARRLREIRANGGALAARDALQ